MAPLVACLFAWLLACENLSLNQWLHRSLACLLANLHVKIDLSVGGSIGRLPLCLLICMSKLISQSVAPSVVWVGVLDNWSSNKQARHLELEERSLTIGALTRSSTAGARTFKLDNRSSNRAARQLELEQRSSTIEAPTRELDDWSSNKMHFWAVVNQF